MLRRRVHVDQGAVLRGVKIKRHSREIDEMMIDARFVAVALDGQASLFLQLDSIRSRLVEEEQVEFLRTFLVRINRPEQRFGQQRVLIRKEDFGGLESDFARFTLL